MQPRNRFVGRDRWRGHEAVGLPGHNLDRLRLEIEDVYLDVRYCSLCARARKTYSRRIDHSARRSDESKKMPVRGNFVDLLWRQARSLL